MLKGLADKAKKAATEKVKEAAKEKVEAAKDEAKAKVEEVKAEAKQKVEEAKENAAATVKEKAEEAKEEVKNATATAAKGGPKNTTRKNNKNKPVENKPVENKPADDKPAEEETPAEDDKPAEKAEEKPATNTLPVVSAADVPFTLPFNNPDRYKEVWDMCTATIKGFREAIQANPDLDAKILTVDADADNQGKFVIKNSTKQILGNLSGLEVMKYMNLFLYYEIVKVAQGDDYGKKQLNTNSPVDTVNFFNKLEARREYHSRICIVLCSMEEPDLTVDAPGFTLNKFDDLERLVYKVNATEKPFSAYEKVFLVDAMMVTLAKWEVDTYGDKLFKDAYMDVIAGDEKPLDLPSHLMLLNRYVNKDKAKAREKYPESLLMNYSYVYPFILYWSGKAPEGPTTEAPVEEKAEKEEKVEKA